MVDRPRIFMHSQSEFESAKVHALSFKSNFQKKIQVCIKIRSLINYLFVRLFLCDSSY